MNGHKISAGISLCLVILFGASLSFASGPNCEHHYVKRVIDGDTFVIKNEGRVRLIGVDTPETVDPRADVAWFGKEASKYLKGMIEGKRVCLKRDKDNMINRGKYNRLLRYVWVDNIFVNRELIARGYAFAYTKYPFQYLEDFRTTQRTARRKGLGLWNKNERLAWETAKRKNLALIKTCGGSGTICPWDALQHTGRRGTVRFFVRKAYDAGDRVFLNSENNYRLTKNFTVMILKSPETEGVDLDDVFRGKTVDVTGEIKLYKGRAEIILKDLSRLRIVQP